MALPILFNDWAFDTLGGTVSSGQGVIVNRSSVGQQETASPQKAAVADQSATPEVGRGGVTITLACKLAGTTITNLRDRYAAVLKNTVPSDGSKKGRLQLITGRHYFAQRVGATSLQIDPGQPQGTFTLTFLADDPYARVNTLKSVAKSPVSSSPTFTLAFATDFDGDAFRIPLVVVVAGPWTAGELFRLENTTAGWIFEKVLENTLTASESMVVDGELFEVLEGTEVSGAGISGGSFPYLKGGVTNSFTVAGSDRFNSLTVQFYDRFFF